MNDGDQTAVLSLSQSDDQPDSLWALSDFTTDEERSAADLAAGFTSVGFIRWALRRGRWLWCATAVVGLLAGFAVFKALPPSYQASTSVLLASNPIEPPGEAVLDDQALVQSRTVAGDALRRLGLRQSAGSFVGDYTVTVITNRVLQITVKATSSEVAVREANALALAFLAFQAHQLQSSSHLVNTSIQQQIIQAQQNISSIGNQINQLSAQPASPSQHAQLSKLQAESSQATNALTVLKNANLANQATQQINSATVAEGSQVLDPATPTPHSRLKLLLIYVLTGLLAGLVLGMFVVIIRALVSDRLRRRDDVARALGAPVKLSVGKVRLSRSRSGLSGRAAAQGPEIRRIAAHLGNAVPASASGIAALVVVPVDDPHVAALSLVSLAVSRAQQGVRVVVADLCGGSLAGSLLKTSDPGVHSVTVQDANLVVAVPGPDDVVPVGPTGLVSPQAQHSAFTDAVAAACGSADLLLTLATLDPSLGGEHLAGWARGAVVVITAGQSPAARIQAVGDMIRLAELELISAVLVGADKTDESLGVPDPSSPSARVGPGMGVPASADPGIGS